MNEPITSRMKDLVLARIDNITSDHQKMISEWNGVDLSDENIRHLYNLFTKCSKADIRMFEDVNFRDDNKVLDVITKRLTRSVQDVKAPHPDNEKSERNNVTKSKAQKKKKKKKQQSHPTEVVSPTNKPSEPSETIEIGEETEKVSEPVEETVELTCSEEVKIEPTAPPLELFEEASDISDIRSEQMTAEIVVEKLQEEKPETQSICKNDTKTQSSPKPKKEELSINNEQPIIQKAVKTALKHQELKKTSLTENNGQQKNDQGENNFIGHSEIERKVAEILQEKRAQKNVAQPEAEQKDKRKNPFDNDHFIIEPLIDNKAKLKDEMDEKLNALERLPGHYINPESNNLKNDLHKLASDISVQEKNMRARLHSGEPASVDGGVLADFISRANTVLKETEAVTVRKIAEAETKKFFSTNNVQPGFSMETISNELMHDIWPKTNKWRSIARDKHHIESSREVDPKTKRKQEDQLARTVQAAIKSAGESLNKKQIGQIRKAAVLYRDFDALDQKELDFRSDQTSKLVAYVSAYEATNRMDELTRLRLAIAFCTKRRDFFLKTRPPNFMQFSYMYIYLLEKLNSKTAAICACLNYQSTISSEFDVLEELLLNLFHEDFFLGCTDD